MDPLDRLRQVPLFAGLADDDLARICPGVEDVELPAGAVLFREGDEADRAYVVIDGQIDVVKATLNREVVIARRGPGEVIGEIALIQSEPRNASVRARTDTVLVAIPKSTLDRLLETSPSAARSLFHTLVDRMRETAEQLRHHERMAQLGSLTAGVAHELNNPAAAVVRAADQLGTELDRLADASAPAVDDQARRDATNALVDRLAARPHTIDGDPLARSDAETELAEFLMAAGVDDPWTFAPALVDAGATTEDLRQAGADLDATALRFVAASVALRRLASEIRDASRRISALVGALRSYSYLDRAPVQDVDVVRGIEETVTLLAHRLSGIRIVRDLAEVPPITANGAELNQVWTNLLTNAVDAVREVDDPTITLRARTGDGSVVVEIEDNGSGVDDRVRDRIFDAFVTTKPPGSGTGLGLQISYRIVVLQHSGDLDFESTPGRTVFRVELPVEPPAPPTPR